MQFLRLRRTKLVERSADANLPIPDRNCLEIATGPLGRSAPCGLGEGFECLSSFPRNLEKSSHGEFADEVNAVQRMIKDRWFETFDVLPIMVCC